MLVIILTEYNVRMIGYSWCAHYIICLASRSYRYILLYIIDILGWKLTGNLIDNINTFKCLKTKLFPNCKAPSPSLIRIAFNFLK